MDDADGHGAFGANGGHQDGGRGPGPSPLSQACNGDTQCAVWNSIDQIAELRYATCSAVLFRP